MDSGWFMKTIKYLILEQMKVLNQGIFSPKYVGSNIRSDGLQESGEISTVGLKCYLLMPLILGLVEARGQWMSTKESKIDLDNLTLDLQHFHSP